MALTEDLGSLFQIKFGTIQAYTAGAKLYRGATVVLHLADSKVYPAEANDTDPDLNQLVIGYTREAAVSGNTVRVQREGRVLRNFIGSTPLVGTLACVFDDETVQAYDASKRNVVVGRILEVLNSQEVYVDVGDRPKRVAMSSYD